MRRSVLLIVVMVIVVCASARTVYVVSAGICDYAYINDLRKTENDARSIASLYRTHTPYVTTLLGSEATHDNILSTLRSVCRQAGEGDAIVFFFSGHGGKGGLCAYDTKNLNTMVTYKEIQDVLRDCQASSKQLFIDACFSGGLRSSSRKHSSSYSQPSSLSNINGVMLFLSSRTDETSKENPRSDNGFFTQYLVKGIKGAADTNRDRIITAKELFQYVSQNVSKSTGHTQNPVMWGKFSDNMHILNWNHR